MEEREHQPPSVTSKGMAPTGPRDREREEEEKWDYKGDVLGAENPLQ